MILWAGYICMKGQIRTAGLEFDTYVRGVLGHTREDTARCWLNKEIDDKLLNRDTDN